jgi:guanylate kinase
MASLIVLSGPSGVGKTTLSKALLAASDGKLIRSISHTTRDIRAEEVEGRDYYFINSKQFVLMLERGDFVEHTQYLNNFYGTSKEFLSGVLSKDQDVLLILDYIGAQSIKKLYPLNTHLIFCAPSSIKVLQTRLEKRKGNQEEIQKRLQIARACLETKIYYDHVVVNDKFQLALNDLCTLINKISEKSIFANFF